ncbi:MAG: GNAT family N-acetyltransferase [Anaerolineae bacterium]|nr:GNAT family N-acetyltransferase [Anaerolineae bacterium]
MSRRKSANMIAMEEQQAPGATIETVRLRLVALSHRQLQQYLDSPGGLELELGISVSRAVLTDRVCGAIAKKVARMAGGNLADHPWYTYWLAIVRDVPFGAGLLGFKGVPNQAGEVEIGYGIDPEYEGQGYTTEAAQALIAWAFRNPVCRAVVAPGTLKMNAGSNRVLQKLGMRLVAESDEANDWRVERAEWPPSPEASCNFSPLKL